MGFKFEKPQKARRERKAAEDAQLTDHQRAYRAREKREEDRFKLAVDSGFWICFCFHDADERRRFAEFSHADNDGWTYGDVLRPALEETIGVHHMRQFKPKPQHGDPQPDPWLSLEPTGNLEEDSLAEADAILAGFEAMEVKEYYDNVFASEYYVICVFRDRGDMFDFIDDFALAKYGNVYMDGASLLKAIGK